MRYPAEETAEKHVRILDQATRMFRDRGFSGVNIADIMKAAGLTHGSFYNHFSSKQGMIEECIMHAASNSIADMERSEPSAAGHQAYIEQYLSVQHRDDPGNGCLMSALAAEVAREGPAKKSMTRHVELYIAKLAAHFPWKKRRHVRADAIRMTATLVGALVLARAVDDDDFSREILREATADLVGRVGSPTKKIA